MLDTTRLKEYDNIVIHATKKGTYALKVKVDDKTVACAYVKHEKTLHKLYRVFVDEENRGKGYGKIIMDAVIDNFGDLDLSLSAYPNRISEMTPENKEEHRARLFTFYERWGFTKDQNSNNMYRFSEKYRPDDIDGLFE